MRKKRKWMPSKSEIQEHKWLKFLHRHMHHEYLWRFDQNGLAKAAVIGMFMCMMPMPFQMIPAAIFAVLFRANIILAVALVWVSNPVTMLPMMYGSYIIGCWLLGSTPIFHDETLSLSHIFSHLHSVFLPLLLGSAVIGLVSGILLAVLIVFGFKVLRWTKKNKKS
ncbi:DUF2062 domain-containing protein [Fangia hongkongensis]|uniref:DUF2062 domain-containing protein n=1 Tax=Fangia hongkongensis TaxID=270495 RepID=UPI00039B99C3|nr:DUF2062 domain-containing protein [Fangia hongkongensis]MBK2124135.1 DUF2062 domain-containing protein [Fangia hongkongensis]